MRKSSSSRTYSKLYVFGWVPLLTLLALPLVRFVDVSGWQIAGVLLLVLAGYGVVVAAERTGRAPPDPDISRATTRAHARAVIVFSVLSVIGCQMVLQEQASYLGDASFENLQERYIALVESSLDGSATSSLLSSVGNILRAFFFVAVTSFVALVKAESSWSKRVALAALLVFALAENFLLNVSRLQLMFFLVAAVVATFMVGHPILRRKWTIAAMLAVLVGFLVFTTNQRLDAKFSDASAAAEYVATFFGVDMLPMGRSLVDEFGIAAFSLVLYVSQSVPELLRLMANNQSPYSLGAHSLYLLLAPLVRIVGVDLAAGRELISNQGFWWGFLGDLYLDFGVLFPLAFMLILWTMVRVVQRIGRGPVYGLALRSLTGGMFLILPYTGIFNTYAVSYFAIAALAAWEQRVRRRVARRKQPAPALHASIIQSSTRA